MRPSDGAPPAGWPPLVAARLHRALASMPPYPLAGVEFGEGEGNDLTITVRLRPPGDPDPGEEQSGA